MENSSATHRFDNRCATLASFKAILEDPESKKPFDLPWARDLSNSIQRHRNLLVGTMALSFTPSVYLALFLLGRATEVQIFGFKFEDSFAIFDVSLLAMCLLGIYGARVAIIMAQAEQLLEAWLDHEYGKSTTSSKIRSDLYARAFEPPIFSPPAFTDPPEMRPTKETQRVRRWTSSGFYLVFGVVAVTVIAIQLWAVSWAVVYLFGFLNCKEFESGARVCVAGGPSVMITAFCTLLTLINFSVYPPYRLGLKFIKH